MFLCLPRYFRQGRWDRAAENFGQVLAMTRHLAPAKRAAWESCYFNLGHAYRKLRRFDDAIDAYEQALALKPNEASTYSALGFAWHLKVRLCAAAPEHCYVLRFT